MRFEVLQETAIRGLRFMRGQVFDGYPEDAENCCVRALGPSPDEQFEREDRLHKMTAEQLRNMCTEKGIPFKARASKDELIRLARGASANTGRITEPLTPTQVENENEDVEVEVTNEGTTKVINVTKRQ